MPFDDNFLARMGAIAEPSFMRPSPPSQPRYANAMAGSMQPQGVAEQPPAQPSGRPRFSAVNLLGGLLDVMSEQAGGKAEYQGTLDAATERRRQAEGDQMARDEFALKKQELQAQTRNQNNEIMFKVGEGVQSLIQRFGPDAARAVAPRLVESGMLTPEQGQFLAENPEQAGALFGEGAEGVEYYGTQYLDQDKEGNLYPYIYGKDGTRKYTQRTPEVPVRPAPLMSIENTGLGFQGLNRYTGRAEGPATPMTGDIKQGITLTTTPEGPVAAPIQGGALDQELTGKVTEMETTANALENVEDVFPAIRAAIDEMALAGSLSGVPAGATTVDGQPISGGSNVGAILQQNVPFLEQATNDQGFSARRRIDSAGRVAIQTIEPLLREAENSKASLTSKQMDTPKELEGLLAQVIDEKDYKAAIVAHNRFLKRYNEIRADLQARIAAAKKKTAAGQRETPAPASSSGRIRYDAQGNRI